MVTYKLNAGGSRQRKGMAFGDSTLTIYKSFSTANLVQTRKEKKKDVTHKKRI